MTRQAATSARTGGRGARTRERIVEAAVEVAARRGITGASMDEIAEAAQVAKGSLYYNFASKDAIFEEVLQAGFQRLDDALGAAGDGVSGRARLRAVTETTLRVLHDNPDLARIMAAEVFRTDRPWGQVLAPVRTSLIVRYRDALRSAALEISAEEGGADVAAIEAHVGELAGAGLFGAIAVAGLDWLLFHPDNTLAEVSGQILMLAHLGVVPPTRHAA
jgi:AcrR family transcriptional regulator